MRPLPPRILDQGGMASWLNWLRDCVADRTPQRSFNSTGASGKGGFRTTPRIDESTSAAASDVSISLFSIASIAATTLSCNQISAGVASTDLTTVKLPPTLQLGTTYFAFETVATVRYTTIMEIVPAYAAGQIIVAGQVDGAWHDLNYDGRQYLEQRQTVQVCVNNVTKLMRIRGSLPHS